MRKAFAKAVIDKCSGPEWFFLTGDLGFMAFEEVREVLKERFINCGVSEQNMISVAAGLAKEGFRVFAYSIAPFCFARPFEQIRNDVCLHDLPVKLLGNGGGYGYGVMGPTHHAIEDYGIMLALPFMKIYIPCFNEDVAPTIASATHWPHPCYIRLGRGELPEGETCPAYQPWRRVLAGAGAVVVSVGPIGGSAWLELRNLPEAVRPDLWILSELPLLPGSLPPELKARVSTGAHLVVVEEHIAHGGVGVMLIQRLLLDGIAIKQFTGLNALGLALGVYGSQKFLREQSGLAPGDIRRAALTGIGAKS
ncbi:MAG: transketolase [Candidatus Omnitrophota bacterium]|jgi:transketolase